MSTHSLIPQIRILPCLIYAWCALYCEAAEQKPIIRNGNFESGKQYWKGDGKVITLEDGNKVGQIIGDDRTLQDLKIEFEMGDLQVVEIRFRARYVGGGGGQLRLKIETRGQGAILHVRDLPADGSWGEFKATYNKKPGVTKFDAVFQALKNKGELQIDDVSAGAPGS